MEIFLGQRKKLKSIRIIQSFRRRFNTYVHSRYTQKFIEFEGRKMYLDEDDSLHLSIRDYAPIYKEFVKKIVKKDNVVVDVGAHIGYYSLLFAELVGEKGHVFSFEPSSNCDILKKNIEINNYKNITAIQKAVSNETKDARLFLTPSLTTHYICDTNDGDYDSIGIQTTTLDDYFKKFDGKIDFMKCVSQGADYAVIQGMSELVKKMKGITIMIAFSPSRLHEFGSNPSEFLATLEHEGFFLYAIRGINEITLTNSSELLKKYTIQNKNGTHLFCTREKLSS